MDDTTPLPDLTELESIHSTLHLIYHRNRNQHSNTKWWKWFSILKRSTTNLISDIQEEELELESRDVEARISARAKHLRARIVPRCYLAFSTVVADKQFSTLGVVLLAVLARLYNAIPSSQDDEKLASTESVDVDVKVPSYHHHSGGVHDGEEDMGEVVRRRPAADDDAIASSSLVSTAQPLPEIKDDGGHHPVGSIRKAESGEEESQRQVPKITKQSKEKKKKKKKRGNDIDDIFGSLV